MTTNYFEYWFENIVSTSRLIADPTAFTRVWVRGEPGITSLISIDEFFEHFLGDLHLEQNILEFEGDLRRIDSLDAVVSFQNVLLNTESAIQNDVSLQKPELLLASPQWESLRKAAARIVEAQPDAVPHSQ